MKLLLVLLVAFLVGCSSSTAPENIDEFNLEITYCRLDSTYGDAVMVYQEREGYIDVVDCDSCVVKEYKFESGTYWFNYYIYESDTLVHQRMTKVELISDTVITL
jgi:hypothetical protein